MSVFIRKESLKNEKDAVLNKTVRARNSWFGLIKKGNTLRIMDCERNQAAGCLFVDANNYEDHYSAVKRRTAQKIYILLREQF
jgi:uncharacterized protein YcgI (DUF1989 family)